jgi:hypothetical protein
VSSSGPAGPLQKPTVTQVSVADDVIALPAGPNFGRRGLSVYQHAFASPAERRRAVDGACLQPFGKSRARRRAVRAGRGRSDSFWRHLAAVPRVRSQGWGALNVHCGNASCDIGWLFVVAHDGEAGGILKEALPTGLRTERECPSTPAAPAEATRAARLTVAPMYSPSSAGKPTGARNSPAAMSNTRSDSRRFQYPTTDDDHHRCPYDGHMPTTRCPLAGMIGLPRTPRGVELKDGRSGSAQLDLPLALASVLPG